MRNIFLAARASVILILVIFAPLPASAAEDIKLDADSISFEETTGVATASGNVRVTESDLKLTAPYVEYDSANQNVTALSTQEGGVAVSVGGRLLNGERLDYNMLTRRGVMTNPNGREGAFYVKGAAIEVMPLSEMGSKYKAAESDDIGAFWKSVSVTTCNYPDPHYRLEAEQLRVIPGYSVIIGKPKVYLGKTMIFKYPFDYLIRIKKRGKYREHYLFPKFGYDSDKGAGIGFMAPIAWDSGSLTVEAVAWTKGIWEGEAVLNQQIAEGLTAYASVSRGYDTNKGETLLRPGWGLEYERNGWLIGAGWSQRELVTTEKTAGRDEDYTVWREPELYISSPWLDDVAAGGKFRVFGTWGKYEDTTYESIKAERYGLGAQVYRELPSDKSSLNIRPFYNVVYRYFGYDDAVFDKQQILDAALGAHWNIGKFSMETSYLRRWVWDASPMWWDDYRPRKDIYQTIGLKLPAKSSDYWWELSVRGAYSIIESELAEMVYSVSYNQHCLNWNLLYRDDKLWNDDWLGFKLTINAYPDSGLRLTGSELFEPSRLRGPEHIHTSNEPVLPGESQERPWGL
ncbi:organic solvent tolerance protein OstA [Synergistales bacterium]|nr:organic solvent tolerance protein OstA [Synergistales bacterium]